MPSLALRPSKIALTALALSSAAFVRAGAESAEVLVYADNTSLSDVSEIHPLRAQVDFSVNGAGGADAYGGFVDEHEISLYGTSISSGASKDITDGGQGGSSGGILDQTFTIVGADPGWDGVLTPTLTGYITTHFVLGAAPNAGLYSDSDFDLNVTDERSSSIGYAAASIEIDTPTITEEAYSKSIDDAMVGDVLTTDLSGLIEGKPYTGGDAFTQSSLARLGFRTNVRVYLQSVGGQQIVCTPTDGDFVIQTVPEPSAFTALGLGAVAMLRRRRK